MPPTLVEWSDLALLEVSDSADTFAGATVRLLRAAARQDHEWPWPSQERRVEAERLAVEDWLASGGSAYGFTTLLGHLADIDPAAIAPTDHLAAREWMLLRAHLVAESRLTNIGAVATRCIVGAKLLQLSRGGSGISLATYRAFVDAWVSLGDVALPVDVSYSCGDVIPAAWLLKRIVGPDELQQGDVIAGISGSHVSTGFGTVALGHSTRMARAVLAWLHQYAATARDGRALQSPVSLRPGSGISTLFDDPLLELERALDARLATPAANPHFSVTADRALEVTSTSAFLDYRLSAALGSVRTALLLGVHHTVALHIAIERSHGSASTLTLQYPKALRALQSRLLQRYGGAAAFLLPVEGASEGLEDAADHSLHLALDVCDLARQTEGLLQIAAEHVAALGIAPRSTSEQAHGRAPGGPSLDDETLELVHRSGSQDA